MSVVLSEKREKDETIYRDQDYTLILSNRDYARARAHD